jgi:hypothetical protein
MSKFKYHASDHECPICEPRRELSLVEKVIRADGKRLRALRHYHNAYLLLKELDYDNDPRRHSARNLVRVAKSMLDEATAEHNALAAELRKKSEERCHEEH